MRLMPSILTSLLLIVGGAAQGQEPLRIGKNYINIPAPAAQVTQLIAPSTNTNGVIIKTCCLSVNPGNGMVLLIVNPTTPALYDVNEKQIFWACSTSTGVGFANLEHPLFIPAGQGIYVSGNIAGGISMTYDMLN
jgi:hypothetical protein